MPLQKNDKIKIKKIQKNSANFFDSLLEKSRRIPPMMHVIFFTILILSILLIIIFGQEIISSTSIIKTNIAKTEEVDRAERFNVFGDHFANDLSIDNNKTNFYYDRITTAFTFSPLYQWQKSEDCFDQYCALSVSDWSFPESSEESPEYCLNKGCLAVSNQELIYQNKKVSMPADLKNAQILSITIYPLNTNWLVGVVYNLNNQESGRAYLFDGRSFTNLDPKNSIAFNSRAGFSGAKFGFGGEADNFLVLYGAYDLQGYQVVDKELINLQSFFGLRIAEGGFTPQIIKQERAGETMWYICSKTSDKPRFVKLWQNGSKSVKGILSFTDKFFKETEVIDSAWCRPGQKPGEVIVNLTAGEDHSTKIFQDNGFNQNKDYVLVTKNLFKETGQILRATFSGFLACDDKKCGEEILNNSLSFTVSGDGSNYKKAKLGQEIIFPDKSKGLYWTVTANSKSNELDYSPWIDGLTSVSYVWK